MKGGIQQASTAVYVILERSDGMVAFVMRSNKSWMNHRYSLLAGRGEHGESIMQGALREAKEEGGVDILPKNLNHVLTMDRNSSDNSEVWIDIFFKVSVWEGEAYNAEPEDHSSLDWLDPHNLPENVVPMQSAALKAIQKGLTFMEYGYDE